MSRCIGHWTVKPLTKSHMESWSKMLDPMESRAGWQIGSKIWFVNRKQRVIWGGLLLRLEACEQWYTEELI